jgi:hypothetical protein
MEDHLPDLSAGGFGVAASVSVSVTPSVPVPFQPPRDLTPCEMAEFVELHMGRSPNTLMGLLMGPGNRSEATIYCLQTIAQVQRSIGRRLFDMIQDQMCADPSGARAFDAGLDACARLARRPLDDDDA